MNVHFTLLLANRAAILLHHFGDVLEKAWIMPYDMPVLKKTLADALLSRPGAPLDITLDDEALDVRLDDLPPLAPWEAQQLADRQRGFHFPGAAFAGSLLRKKERRVVHAASDVDDKISKTMESLYSIGNPINASSFFALECAGLAMAMPEVPKHPFTLLLFVGEATGLRQVVMKDGLPVFTRLHSDCVPSLGADVLAKEISRHVQSTLDFLPRLQPGIGDQVAVQLFVPEMLKDLDTRPEIRTIQAQVIAMQAPKSDLVPPEWGLDIAFLARIALQRKKFMPFAPEWQKGRTQRLILRQDISIFMFVFGCIGVAYGLDTLLNRRAPPPASPPAMAQPASLPKAKEKPPTVTLDAVIYNGESDWSVWINGQKYTPARKDGQVSVKNVTPEGVRVVWKGATAEEEYFLTSQNTGSLVTEERP